MEPEKKSNGALIGTIVVIIILILGGLYIWMSKSKVEPIPENITANEQEAASIEAYNELNTFETDVSETDVNLNVNTETLQ
jgi:flagellar basal body-associated protein FliL